MIMDILLQYLNIRKNKQEYIKVLGVPCNTVYQALEFDRADIVTGKQIGRAHV